jgi:predicted amidohydrolase YtcJ
MLGESLHYVNLESCESISELKELVLTGHQNDPDLPFIIGFNWDHEKMERLPSVHDLEELAIDKPVSESSVYHLESNNFYDMEYSNK